MTTFGRELGFIRQRAKYSQYALAKDLELSRSYICKLESGERPASKELILKIAQVLKMDDYNLNKLFILSDIDPQLSDNHESFQICLRLALEFKKKGLLDKAKSLIDFGISLFDNMIELYALMANSNLLNNNYDDAINANEKALSDYSKLGGAEKSKLGITEAEIIHNLGTVYFERALNDNKEREQLIISGWTDPAAEEQNKLPLARLEKGIRSDLDISVEKIESAFSLEPQNEHIMDQLARIYFNQSELAKGDKKAVHLQKSVDFYELLISRNSNDEEENMNKQDASVFLSLAFAKLFKLGEAGRLINTVINYKPLYYLGYYTKSCIYSFNGKNNETALEIAYDSLKHAIKLNPDLKKYINWELDLYNLRFNKVYSEKFKELWRSENDTNTKKA